MTQSENNTYLKPSVSLLLSQNGVYAYGALVLHFRSHSSLMSARITCKTQSRFTSRDETKTHPRKQQEDSTHLICITENDALQAQGENHVQKQDFVAPNDSLLFGLAAQPLRPLIRDQRIGEAVVLRKSGHKSFELRREEVFDEPEFDRRFGAVCMHMTKDGE